MPALLDPPVETNQLSKRKKTSYIPFSWEDANADYCAEEPPVWHAAVLEERAWEMERCKELGRDWDEAIKELKVELGIQS